MPNLLSTSSEFDVVIVGSGLGGLLCAVLLAKEGMKVCVLEKNRQIGGCLQTFALHKKVFDSCVHYIGGLGEGHTLNRIFRYAGIMNQLNLQAYDANGFDKITFGNDLEEYPQAVGTSNFIKQLIHQFPEEEGALKRYIALVKDVTARFPMYHLQNYDGTGKAAVMEMELSTTIAGITKNILLQQVLMGNSLLYAGVKGKTPFYVHALVLESYLHSTHKVVPGSSQISRLLAKEFRKYGGEIVRNTAVARLQHVGGSIVCAETNDGKRYAGRQFIAAIHPDLLSGMLDAQLLRPAFHHRVAGLEQTISAFMVNIVLKPGKILYQHHNLYWNATKNALAAINASEWPANYALYYGEDPIMPGYADRLSILTYMPASEIEPWENSYNNTAIEGERGPEYQYFKEMKAKMLVNKVSERLPALARNIVAQSIATPLTFRDYTGTPEGAMYGILKDVQQGGRTIIHTKTRIPNLLLTGQNINLHGVLGVSITAVLTAAELLGLDYLLAKINQQE